MGISIGVLVLLLLLTIGIWVLVNVGGVLFLLLSMGSEDIRVSGISLAEFLENFVGSPMFYIYMADLAVLLCSAVVLGITRKK